MKARLLFSLPVVLVLAGGWLLLHGDWSVANVIGGVVLGTVLVLLFPLDRTQLRHRLHPWAFVKLVGFVLYSLVLSSWAVIKVIVRPTPDSLRAGVVRVTLRHESQLTTTLVANAVTLTPGTMTLTARLDPAELHIHVLGLADPDEFRESVHDLERRAVAALTPITLDPIAYTPGEEPSWTS
jgi:multicomponent Na+:H+ antiporter subunit E